MIYVCPLSKVAETVASTSASRLVSLLTAGTMMERPASIQSEHHLLLSMHDIVDARADHTPPGEAHVHSLLEFARVWPRERALVINCFAGISRSTAAAYIVAAALNPARDERELAEALRRASPSATPNSRLVALADAMLSREGRMISAIASIGRGTDAFEGIPFMLDLER